MSIDDSIRKIIKSEIDLAVIEIKNAVESLKHQKRQVSFVTREEAAKQLRVSLPTIDKWTKMGELISIKKGRRVLYDASQFESFFEKATEPNINDYFKEQTELQSNEYGKQYTDAAIKQYIHRQGIEYSTITPEMIEWYRQRYKLNKTLKNYKI